MKKTVILVVEDEALIRMAAVEILEDAGFAALEACNADVAMEILGSRNDIRAVFTDITMPGTLDGLRLVRLIEGRWPPIHLIVASGQTAPTPEDFPAFGRFIRKPYDARIILAVLDELLGGNPGPYRYVADAVQDYGRAFQS